MLARQAVAAVGVRTRWPWETAATLPSARHIEGRGHIVAAPAYSLLFLCPSFGREN